MTTEAVIDVFKTNVTDARAAGQLLAELGILLPGHCINFDLDDCDKILRVKGESVDRRLISRLLQRSGFECEAL